MGLTDEVALDGVFEGKNQAKRAENKIKLAWVGKGALALIDQGLLSGSNFLIGILLARWLSPDNYGAYALGFSIFLFLSGFHNAFFLEPMSVLGPESYSRCLPSYVKKLFELHFGMAFLLSVLAVAGVWVMRFFSTAPGVGSAMWGVAIAIPLVLFHWLCRRAVYLKLAPWLAAVSSAAYCIALVGLLLALKSSISPFTGFLVQSLAAIPAIVLLLLSLKSDTESVPGPSTLHVVREHWRYGRWVVGSTVVYWLSGNAYYVIVAALLPMHDLAALRALRNFTLPFAQALTAITLLVLPWASSRFAQEGRLGLKRRTRQLTALFGGGALVYFSVIWLFGGRVMNFLYAGRYDDFAHLLALATAPLLLIAASVGSEVAVQVMQAPSEVFLAYSVSGALTLLMGIAFTHYWGLAGGLVGLLISSVAFWAVITYRCHKRLQGDFTGTRNTEHAPAAGERVAWLMPTVMGAYYWQPIFQEFTALIPNTVIFAGAWPGTLPAYRGKFEVRPIRGVRFVTLGRGGAGYPTGFMWASPAILRELIRFRPNVILTSGFNLWSAYVLMFKRFMKWRVVLIWEGVSPTISCSNSPLQLAMRRIMAKHFNAAITNSRAGADYLQAVLRMPAGKIVRHPIEVAEAPALARPKEDITVARARSSFAFLVVGQLIERKGIHRLFEAAKLLLDRGIDDFSIQIAGTGDMAQALLQQVADSHLDKVVEWLGFVSYQNLGAHYQASDAVILPSLEDTWGMVVLEAMSMGKPVLCSKHAGAKEMIEDGVNGFVIDPQNLPELAGRMELLIRVPGLAKKMGEKSKEILRPYTTRRAAEVLAKVAVAGRQFDSSATAAKSYRDAATAGTARQT
jgi:glycosyltransferase involved in cell wall biosynthesis/O-antigen/teichoic acid export membrane protein